MTLIVTNLIKVTGLGVGAYAGFVTQSVPGMFLGGFMMAGAQVSETTMLAIIDRFFAVPGERK